MNDKLFDVIFLGTILEGHNPEEVKARVAKMFQADAAKVAQLFSGKRIVIKKNANQQTASKYQTALNRAGADCKIQPLAVPAVATSKSPTTVAPAPTTDDSVSLPPQTDPLGITADDIADLAVSVAPAGSDVQEHQQPVDSPRIDISGIDVLPIGENLTAGKKEPDLPLPDISGLSVID